MSGVCVVLESRQARIGRISWEALAAARQLAAGQTLPLKAVLLGAETELLATEIALHDTERVVRLEHPLLATYTADGYACALQQFLETEQPQFVAFPHTYQVRDYAPAVAARMGQALIADVTAIGPGPVFARQLLGGRLNGTYRSSGAGPCFLSVQAGAFPASTPSAARAPVDLFTPTLDANCIRVRAGEPFPGVLQTVDLSSATRIVSVGRGIQNAEHIALAQQLATALGAELGASRPICDNGWLPLDRQIGSSGQTVRPRLYFALGISGAIQHLVGMKGSECIVAINKDPGAPIFEVADYGIVGDLFEVIPALISALRASG